MKKSLFITLLLFSYLSNSCSELADCIASARPDLPKKTLLTGTSGIGYNDFIEARIVNDPNDDLYDYFFDIDGNLPQGMYYFSQGNKLFFAGTPSQTGTFTFKVNLDVDYPDSYNDGFGDDNRFCFGDDSTSKSYTITIQ